MIPVGFSLQPDDNFFELLREVVRCETDYLEVTPETLWRCEDDGSLLPNGFHQAFLEFGRKERKPFVAHGVGLSMGTASARDADRRRRWLARMKADQQLFHYRWYTDHLGASSLDGLNVTLPLPLPMTQASVATVRGRLRQMRRVVPLAGVENNVAYFLLGQPLDEPAFLNAIVAERGSILLLDLHNLYTMSVNFDFDPGAYLARLNLDRVVEIHLSGGAESDPAWLPSGRQMRLDSHDHTVPEPVWTLFGSVASNCPNLRGVTLERMEGTVRKSDVVNVRDELRRVRHMLRSFA